MKLSTAYALQLLLLGAAASSSVAFEHVNPSAKIIVGKNIKAYSSLQNKEVRITTASKAVETRGGDGGGERGSGTATVSEEVINLVKNIVGAGVLSLPAGIAAFGNAPSAAIPAVALIAIIGGLSGYCFSLIGRVCSFTGGTSYRDAWAQSVSPSTSWIPAVTCTLKTTMASLAYSMILADTCTNLLQTAGIAASRTTSLLGITSLVLLPLCLLKNLSSLAPFSLLGSLGMGYTTIAMAIRYFGKTYALGPPTGKFVSSISSTSLMPSFGSKSASSVVSPSVFILISMLSTAYMSHFNAPKFFNELKDNTIARYNKVVGISFATSIAIFAGITSLGYLTFGAASSGLILNNYANTDTLMGFSRVAVLVSLIFSYPLCFVGVRDGAMDLLKITNRSNRNLNTLTVALLSMVTLLALAVKDLSFVMAFAGATLGNALIYVFPVIMFRSVVKKMPNPSKALQREAQLGLGLLGLGIGMGGLGAKMALASLSK